MEKDLQEFYYAAAELGVVLGAEKAEEAWPEIQERAEKLERENGMRPILALAQAALLISEAA